MQIYTVKVQLPVYLGTDFSGKKHNIISLLLAWFRWLATVEYRLNLQTETEKPFEKCNVLLIGFSTTYPLSGCYNYHTREWSNSALQRQNTENSKQIFPEKELCGLSVNFHIHVSVSDLYIGLPILL
jgi:hypothetical protein